MAFSNNDVMGGMARWAVTGTPWTATSARLTSVQEAIGENGHDDADYRPPDRHFPSAVMHLAVAHGNLPPLLSAAS